MGGASIAPVHSSVVRYVNGLINRPLSGADFEGITALDLATPPNIPLVAPPQLNTEFEVRRLPREVSLRERSYLGAQAATSAMAVGVCRFLSGEATAGRLSSAACRQAAPLLGSLKAWTRAQDKLCQLRCHNLRPVMALHATRVLDSRHGRRRVKGAVAVQRAGGGGHHLQPGLPEGADAPAPEATGPGTVPEPGLLQGPRLPVQALQPRWAGPVSKQSLSRRPPRTNPKNPPDTTQKPPNPVWPVSPGVKPLSNDP